MWGRRLERIPKVRLAGQQEAVYCFDSRKQRQKQKRPCINAVQRQPARQGVGAFRYKEQQKPTQVFYRARPLGAPLIRRDLPVAPVDAVKITQGQVLLQNVAPIRFSTTTAPAPCNRGALQEPSGRLPFASRSNWADNCHRTEYAASPLADSLPASDLHDEVTIVTAALATSAAPTYFHPTAHAGRAYIDGGIGFNNPAEIALKQLSTLYGPSAYAYTLVSLGTGRRNENPYRPGAPRARSGIAGMIDMLRAFAHISTDAEGVHARLEERFAQTGAYFRFNPIGLEDVELDDWTAVDDAIKASLDYLALPETQKRISELAERLLRARGLIPE
ncbi:FabD/lysophospholipase-like protein [Sanghuangporus baumii]|uniref:FabD/lysophospholipase-like protein n=1 Tax=Sanghuangporus baumii TaxID=108892 RepID=A0A9Q5I5M9_SANBA|nr:FabD/lysophospholipase-like protein [Sanghuangporus baumii]